MESFSTQAAGAGFNYGLILDYLDQLGQGRWMNVITPTMEGLQEYAKDAEAEFNSQSAWDTKHHLDPVNVGGYHRGISGV